MEIEYALTYDYTFLQEISAHSKFTGKVSSFLCI